LPSSIRNDIHDPPHVLVGGATDFLAKDTLYGVAVENHNGYSSWGPGGGRPVNCWLRHGAILAYRVERSGKSD
jgi:hypothetical protein